MRSNQILTSLLALPLMVACLGAHAACELRVGYTDQDVPPYYMGAGAREASPPGASIELIREMAGVAGCSIVTTRLPPLRLVAAVEAGKLDALPLGLPPNESVPLVYPLDKNGRIDREHSMQMHTMIFVRAADKLARDGDPMRVLQGKRVGTTHGATYAATLRQYGFEVDDGATDTRRNFEKLLRQRTDAFAISLANPGDMDAVVASQYGGDITRLDKPIRVANIWFPVSRAFFAEHREQAEAMWAWLGAHGSARFAQLLKKYDRDAGG
ncbi:MAG: transporter substrate-binding domain-containing protein [Pseudomonadota bacterium]